MPRATNDEWNRYYKVASERRRARGGDPLDRLIKRHVVHEKIFVVGSSVFVAALVMACYEVLVR
jgi:hypothetical protein